MLKKNSIRIISGKWKSIKIYFIKNNTVRPTTDKRREMIFNWLLGYINNSYCLDCFSGTGILGIESVSRNASCAVLIEKNYKTYNFLKKNIKKLNSNKIKIFKKNIFTWIKKTKKKFNIVFVDPPFYKNLVNKTLFLLEKNNVLELNAFIYVEIENNNVYIIFPKTWILYKEKIFKNVICRLYKKIK